MRGFIVRQFYPIGQQLEANRVANRLQIAQALTIKCAAMDQIRIWNLVGDGGLEPPTFSV